MKQQKTEDETNSHDDITRFSLVDDNPEVGLCGELWSRDPQGGGQKKQTVLLRP